MDASYLSQQVNTIIGQLHGLFDEIGVSNHERERREEEVSTAPDSSRSVSPAIHVSWLTAIVLGASSSLHFLRPYTTMLEG